MATITAARHPAPALARPAGLLAGFALLALLCVASLVVGSRAIPLADLAGTLADSRDDGVGAVVWGMRYPRTLVGLAAGGALGMAGALMQGLTRNPLADPGLLGVSAGAGAAMVIGVAVLGTSSLSVLIWLAFAGALLASLVVYALGSAGRGGARPVKLALAGVAVTALLTSVTSAVLLVDAAALNTYRFWAVGALTGRSAADVADVLPFLLVGALLAVACAPALNSLALGDDVASSLGRRVGLTRLRGMAAVTLLTGGAVALAGPIVFVGLVVPHIARAMTGADFRWLLPYSMLLAACLLLAADVLGRVVARPAELQVGVVTAVVGAPFFIALVRRRRLKEL